MTFTALRRDRRNGSLHWLLIVRRAFIVLAGVLFVAASLRIVFPQTRSWPRLQWLIRFEWPPGSVQTNEAKGLQPGAAAPTREQEVPLRVFSRSLSSEAIQRAAAQLAIPIRLAPDRLKAMLSIEVAPRTTSELVSVPVDGAVTLSVPTANPKELVETLRQYTDWRPVGTIQDDPVLGLLPVYASAALAQPVFHARANKRRWVSVPMLSGNSSRFRLVPSLQMVRQGERGHVDLQLYGFDGEWYSLTERPEVQFRVIRGAQLLIGTREAGTYLAVVDRRVQEPYEEAVIEATVAPNSDRPVTTRAVILVIPENRLR